eukprot:6083060-Pleurochrysis_carterae.AAC.1
MGGEGESGAGRMGEGRGEGVGEGRMGGLRQGRRCRRAVARAACLPRLWGKHAWCPSRKLGLTRLCRIAHFIRAAQLGVKLTLLGGVRQMEPAARIPKLINQLQFAPILARGAHARSARRASRERAR